MLIIGCLISACTTPAPPVRICTNLWPGYEPLYLARSLGYFDPSAIQLVEYVSATDCLRAFGNGALEAAALTLDETFLLAADEAPLKIVLVMDISQGADALLARPHIQTLADLKNHRVGVENTAVGAYLLTRALQQGGLTRGDVQIVPLVINEQETAFRAKMIDAVVTFEPVRTRLLAAGAHQLFSSREIPGEIMDVLVMQRTYIERYPEQVDLLRTSWFKALEYLRLNPQDAARRMSGRLQLSSAEFLGTLESVHLPGLEENQQLLTGTQPAIVLPARQIIETMRAAQLLRRPLTIEELL